MMSSGQQKYGLVRLHKLYGISMDLIYRIAGMFGRAKVWQTALSKVVGEKKLGEFGAYQCSVALSGKLWMVLVWRMPCYSPNLCQTFLLYRTACMLIW